MTLFLLGGALVAFVLALLAAEHFHGRARVAQRRKRRQRQFERERDFTVLQRLFGRRGTLRITQQRADADEAQDTSLPDGGQSA